jgi:hypothetical protein
MKRKAKNQAIFWAAVFLITSSMLFSHSYALERSEDGEIVKAKETLINFFSFLHAKHFREAVSLFAPAPSAECGSPLGSWDWLEAFSPHEDRGDKSKVLEHYCNGAGTCLNASVLNIEKIGNSKYRLRVRFFRDDGSIFSLGACCGEQTDRPPSTSFVFCVEEIDGIYKVRTVPVYVP